MKKTENFNLLKPDGNENYNIQDFNTNMDIIDRRMYANMQAVIKKDEHISDKNNPHGVTKSQVGLSKVNNTSDLEKPVSTLQQQALDKKQDKLSFDSVPTKNSNKMLNSGAVFAALENVKNTSSSSASGDLPFALSKQGDKYGYINDSGVFVPFKSQADIDSAVSAAKVGTATPNQVLSGYTFTNKDGSGKKGTMENGTNQWTWTNADNNGGFGVGTYQWSKGGTTQMAYAFIRPKYVDNTTKIIIGQKAEMEQVIKAGSSIAGVAGTFASQEKAITASRSAQTVTPDSGKWLSKVTVNKYPDATGTYTPTANSSASDMGATNNYRYVNTNNVYNLGVTNGKGRLKIKTGTASVTTSSAPYTTLSTETHIKLSSLGITYTSVVGAYLTKSNTKTRAGTDAECSISFLKSGTSGRDGTQNYDRIQVVWRCNDGQYYLGQGVTLTAQYVLVYWES